VIRLKRCKRDSLGVSTVVTGIFIMTAALMAATGYMIVAGKNYGLKEEMTHQAAMEETALRIAGAIDTLTLRGEGGDMISFPVRLGTWGRATTATSRAVGGITFNPGETTTEIFLDNVNYALAKGSLKLSAEYNYASPISYYYTCGGVFYKDQHGVGVVKQPTWRVEHEGNRTWLTLQMVTLTGDFQKEEGYSTASIRLVLHSKQEMLLPGGYVKILANNSFGRLGLLGLKSMAETSGMKETSPSNNSGPDEFHFMEGTDRGEMHFPHVDGIRITLTVIEVELRRL